MLLAEPTQKTRSAAGPGAANDPASAAPRQASTHEAAAHDAAPAQAAESVQSAPRVLLVDDDEAVRVVVADFLGDLGMPVLLAANAAEAVAMLEKHPSIALLLSDIRMAGMSGIDLAEQAARLRPALRIVLMSGYFLPQPVARRFLRKPFRLTELETLLREELGP